VTTFQWLLGFHVLGAFLFISGAVAAGVLQTAALRRERPSEVASLLGLTRIAVAAVGVGSIVAFVFGAWLVSRLGLDWGDGWITGALVLFVVSGALGGIGGRSARHARELAERLATEGDTPSRELKSALADPKALALSYASFLAAVAILALMIWKPGA
jgi:uncharacterized membrane protein